MKERMKEPYEKGLANRSAPSFAPRSVRGEAKRKQGIGGLGIELRKDAIRMLTPYTGAESHMDGNDNASPRTILRSQRPQSTPRNFMHETRALSPIPTSYRLQDGPFRVAYYPASTHQILE